MKFNHSAHQKVLPILGVFLLVISLVAIFNAFFFSTKSILFWFCYLSLPLAGIGILTKSSNLIKSQLYILAIPDLIWTFDLIMHIITGNSFLGIVDYLFTSGHFLPKLVTFQHLIAIPIMFYVLLVLKSKKENSWKISLIQIALVYVITRLFTNALDNINCVYDLCGKYALNLPYLYPFIWFMTVLLMIYLSRKIFVRFYSLFKKVEHWKV